MTIMLEDAIKKKPNTLPTSNEIIENITIKTDLLKTELFGSLCREFNIVNFLEENLKNLKISDKGILTVDKFIDLMNNYKTNLEEMKKENKDLKDIIFSLKNVIISHITLTLDQ